MNKCYKTQNKVSKKSGLLFGILVVLSLQIASFKATAQVYLGSNLYCSLTTVTPPGTQTSGSSCTTGGSGGTYIAGWTPNAYWQYVVNTAGYGNITMSYTTSASATGPHSATVSYNIGAGDVPFATYTLSGTSCTTESFNLPAAVDNITTHLVQIKITMSGSTNVAGTNRISYDGNFYGTVFVPTVPVVTTPPVNDTICAGSNASFSAVATGATSYQWQRSATGTGGTFVNVDNVIDGGIYSNYTTATLNLTAPPGPLSGYAYRIVATNATGDTNSTAATLIISPKPVVTSAVINQGVCNSSASATINFTSSVTGATYTWANSVTAIGLPATGSGSVPSFTAINTGSTPTTAIITVTPAFGSCIGTAQADTIVVKPTPIVTVSADTTICIGAQATLTAIGAATYSWLPTAGLTPATGATVSASPAGATSYTVTGTATNGCSATATTKVSLYPAVTGLQVTPSAPAICNGSSVKLMVSANVIAFSENFNSPLQGWTVDNTNTTPASIIPAVQWKPELNGYSSGGKTFYTPDGSAFYLADANSGGTNTIDDILTSPSFSLAGLVNATLNYNTFLDKGNNEIYDAIEVSVNGGATWTLANAPVSDYTGATVYTLINKTVDLSAYAGQNNVMIRFHYNTYYGYYWALDNVIVSGTPVATWSPVTSAFTNAPLTSPYAGSSTDTLYVNPPNNTTVPTSVVYTASVGICKITAQSTVTINPIPVVNISQLTQSMCSGAITTAISFTGTVAGTAYNWVNSAPSIGLPPAGAGNINPFTSANTGTVPVTAAITVTPVANLCPGTPVAATITVNPYPQAVITASANTTSCTNDSVIVSANTGANLIYQWTSNGIAIPNAVNSNYDAHTNGTYRAIVGAFGCLDTSAPVSVTIRSTPYTPIYNAGGFLTHCTGDSVILNTITSFTPNYYTYQWVKDGNAINGATTPAYLAFDAGAYNVVVTHFGCPGTSAVLNVAVNTKQDSLSELVSFQRAGICQGGTDMLQVDSLPNLTYRWYANGNIIPNAFSPHYIATAASTYAAGITNVNGCTLFTAPVNIFSSPAPVPTVSNTGKQLCTEAFTAYQWYLNGVAITGAIHSCVAPQGPGGYTVMATNSTGCQGISEPFYFSSGVNTVVAEDVKLYPNPATSIVNISAPQQVNVSVISIDGKELMNVTDAHTIDISRLANAVYMIKVYDKYSTLIKVEKLVKTSW